MLKVSVVGAAGYTGRELVGYLLKHPEVQVTHCTSETFSNVPISSIHPNLSGRFELVTEKLDVKTIARDSDLVFLCLPHGNSAKIVKQFLDHKIKVIDFSADFRFKTISTYQEWYGVKHPFPELLKSVVYGLPEIYREEIAKADCVANPGCYSTVTILSLLPLIKKGLIKTDSIIVDAKSGISGAGKKMDARYLFCETNENFLAYSVDRHRHYPEIEQELNKVLRSSTKGSDLSITFVPHLLPINRGILVTIYANLKKKISNAFVHELYTEFYKNEPFIVILPEGTFPEVKSVQNSNFCHIAVQVNEKKQRVIIVGVIDNLGKGASGQAVQNMNLLFQLDERCGLE